MLGPTGLNVKFQLHLADLQARSVAGVLNLDNVRILFSDDRRRTRKLTRAIR